MPKPPILLVVVLSCPVSFLQKPSGSRHMCPSAMTALLASPQGPKLVAQMIGFFQMIVISVQFTAITGVHFALTIQIDLSSCHPEAEGYEL